MTFGSPWFLLGSLGAIVPVLLHLYGRQHARRETFPSLMLLQRAQREYATPLRLRQLWLLLLRALLILLLSLALSQPVLRGPRLPGLPGTPVVCLLDNSLSMTAGQTPNLAPKALTALRTMQRRLPAGQEYSYALLPEGETAEALATARGQALPEMLAPWPAPARGPVDLAAALGMVGPQLTASVSGQANVVLFTDLQATAWRSDLSGWPQDRGLLVVDCGQDAPNAALTGLEVSEPPALAKRPLRLRVTVQRWPADGPPVTLPVGVTIKDRALPATQCRIVGGHGEVLVEWIPPRAEQLNIRAFLPADRLLADNEARLQVTVRQQLQVGVVGAPERTRWLRLALAPRDGGPVQVRARPRGVNMADDVVVVANGSTAGLDTYLEQGGGALLFAPSLPAATLGALGEGAPHLGEVRRPSEPVHFGHLDSFRPPLAAFANAAAGDLQAPEFRTYRAVVVPPDSPWQVLARFTDETPALLSARVGRGRVMLANFAAEPGFSSLTSEPVFVPLLHRLVGAVARVVAEDAPAECADPLESDLRRLTVDELRQRLAPWPVEVCRAEEVASRLPVTISLATPCWLLALLVLAGELWLLGTGQQTARRRSAWSPGETG